MRRSIVLAIASWIVCVEHVQNLGAQPNSVSLEDIRRSLATVADTLPTFETEDFIYNRWPRLSGLVESNYDSDRLVQLLDDTRPAVRTLALALLFSKEDPKFRPTHIARHLGDTARTFPVLLPTVNADPTRIAPQTVGDVVKAMLGAYMLAAGMKEWRDPHLDDSARLQCEPPEQTLLPKLADRSIEPCYRTAVALFRGPAVNVVEVPKRPRQASSG